MTVRAKTWRFPSLLLHEKSSLKERALQAERKHLLTNMVKYFESNMKKSKSHPNCFEKANKEPVRLATSKEDRAKEGLIM